MNLFAYGTLMDSDILAAVAGRTLHGEVAMLPGYRRVALQGADYPGVYAEHGAQVLGVLYHELSPAAWVRLDAFETEEYRRVPVSVSTATLQQVDAQVYCLDDRTRCLNQSWDLDAFLRGGGRERFLAAYRGWGLLLS